MDRITAAVEEGDEQALRELYSERISQQYQEPDAAFLERLQRSRWPNLLKLYFDLCNRRYATARLLVTILYIFGFTALAIPSLNLFWRVANVAIETGFGAHQLSPQGSNHAAPHP